MAYWCWKFWSTRERTSISADSGGGGGETLDGRAGDAQASWLHSERSTFGFDRRSKNRQLSAHTSAVPEQANKTEHYPLLLKTRVLSANIARPYLKVSTQNRQQNAG